MEHPDALNRSSSSNFVPKWEAGDLMKTRMMGDGVYSMSYPMTDEQIEVLRQQIAVFASICERLVEMHKSVSARQDAIAETSMGHLYCDPLMMTGTNHKIAPRQRWSPTPIQLQVLENLFQNGIGTPSKQRIREITSELSGHGQISETNVYNWFQNRRARSKRKAQPTVVAHRTSNESETETENESSKIIKRKSEEGSSEAQSMNQDSMRMPLIYDSGVLNPGVNQFMGEMENPEGQGYF